MNIEYNPAFNSRYSAALSLSVVKKGMFDRFADALNSIVGDNETAATNNNVTILNFSFVILWNKRSSINIMQLVCTNAEDKYKSEVSIFLFFLYKSKYIAKVNNSLPMQNRMPVMSSIRYMVENERNRIILKPRLLVLFVFCWLNRI